MNRNIRLSEKNNRYNYSFLIEEEEEKKPKKEGKTMTGKPMTKIDVNPDMKEKKVK